MGRARVLLVEDDMLIAWTISALLKQLGCTVVDYADNAEQAGERAIAVRPDVILLDIGLAGPRDGLEAAEGSRAPPGPSASYPSGPADDGAEPGPPRTPPPPLVLSPSG